MSDELDIVFLDRDGTLNSDESGYPSDAEQFVLLPGAIDAVRALNQAGIKAVVITNQSGIGRGFFTAADLAHIHARLTALLAEGGARLDGIYACPHRPDEACACRKPGMELALRAARALGVDPARSAMVGDKAVDLELGRRLGGRTVLVLTGHGMETAAELSAEERPDYIAKDVYDAIQWLVFRHRRA